MVLTHWALTDIGMETKVPRNWGISRVLYNDIIKFRIRSYKAKDEYILAQFCPLPYFNDCCHLPECRIVVEDIHGAQPQ